MTNLALIRHGHTAWNRAGKIQGRTDIPLDTDARAHLSALRLPGPWDNAAIVSSPLKRAMETAELISGQSPIAIPQLIEMDWGKWEGLHGVDLRNDTGSGYSDIEEWTWGFCPPGGESLADLRDRLLPWVTGLTSDTVAVCHIGVMRVLLAIATGWDFTGAPPFRIKRDRLFVLDVSTKRWALDATPVRLVERQS
ncbi:MAG: histidine phosphatase family protein [Pseudomonadota bacterium]